MPHQFKQSMTGTAKFSRTDNRRRSVTESRELRATSYQLPAPSTWVGKLSYRSAGKKGNGWLGTSLVNWEPLLFTERKCMPARGRKPEIHLAATQPMIGRNAKMRCWIPPAIPHCPFITNCTASTLRISRAFICLFSHSPSRNDTLFETYVLPCILSSSAGPPWTMSDAHVSKRLADEKSI